MSRSVRVSIAGKDFSVRTDAKPKYVRELAKVVEEKMDNVRTNSMSTQNVIIMAALSLADDLLQAKLANKVFRREIQERSKRILETLGREEESC